MTSAMLVQTARALVADDKGLLAMDESVSTCNKRFAALGINQTEEMRRNWRELVITTPTLSDSISGVILVDETIRQRTRAGTPFARALIAAGLFAGIKVDAGATALAGRAGETITEGLDGLRERLTEYAHMGARFAKWRAVFRLGDGMPSRVSINANAHALARYAKLCQEAMLVPIIEPEVLMEGGHSLAKCAAVTEEVLHVVFNQLHLQGVSIEGSLLKPNMVLPGLLCHDLISDNEIADATLSSLARAVPAAVSGIVFLSGGQSGKSASARLNAINVRRDSVSPWPLSFSFARAIQHPAMESWGGVDANVVSAQQVLLHRARCNQAARRGVYNAQTDSFASLTTINKGSIS